MRMDVSACVRARVPDPKTGVSTCALASGQMYVCARLEDRCKCVLSACGTSFHSRRVGTGGARRAGFVRCGPGPGFVPGAQGVGGRLQVGSWLPARGASGSATRPLRQARAGPSWGPRDLELSWGLPVARLVWVGADSGQAVRPGQDVFILNRTAGSGRGSCGCVPRCFSPQLLWALRSLQRQKCGEVPSPFSVARIWPSLQ